MEGLTVSSCSIKDNVFINVSGKVTNDFFNVCHN